MADKQPTQEQLKPCPHLRQPGSYYDLLPWGECKLMNKPIYQRGDGTLIPSYLMCAYDRGEECPYGF